MLVSPDGWIYYPRPEPRATWRLFCFPGGGADASLFFPWAQLLPSSCEVGAVQLPGRAPDLDFPCRADAITLTREIAGAIGDACDLPCIFFGHSLGALLAFEVARCHLKASLMPPAHLFLACAPPPSLPEGVEFARSPARTVRRFPETLDTLSLQGRARWLQID
ncbi:MAG TPA: alpha/beta fold hydrolase, partial [Ktedonosporobacter sp.]|nr:alpha/beta fold hydrolase [Ktedonosporobacter sp.]